MCGGKKKMNDFTVVVLADVVNLMSHLNIFQTQKHDSSCLICCAESPFMYTTRLHYTNFFTVPTSNDLMLLHSGASQNETRQVLFLQPTVVHYEESCFERELGTYLHFNINRTPFDPMKSCVFKVLVIVAAPNVADASNFKLLHKQSKKIFLIFPRSEKNIYSHHNATHQLMYDDYKRALKTLIHISLITKQRVRVKDLREWFGIDSFQSCSHDENECIFI